MENLMAVECAPQGGYSRAMGETDHSGHRARLRHRLLDAGGDALADYELVEYLLALAIPRRDTKPLAKRLLDEFGSLAQLISADPESLRRVDGLGDGAIAALKIVQAVSLRMLKGEFRDKPLLSSWDALLDWLRAEGCNEVQGFLFSAARPAAEIAKLLADFGQRASRAA